MLNIIVSKELNTYTYIGKTMTQYVLTVTEWLDFSGIADYFRKLEKKREHNRNVRITIKELSKLSDRELNDIGIARGDIWAVAHGDGDYARNANPESNENLKGWV